MKSIIGDRHTEEQELVDLNTDRIYETNTSFWNYAGSEYLGVTALPFYGAFVSEDKLHLFGDITGKRVLDIGCGNGHSLEYISGKHVSELWGLDISQEQLNKTGQYLNSKKIKAHLVCSPMETECELPKSYFDVVYSVYAIGWTTDLLATVKRISSYLKKDGIFIFSWSHPIHKCVSIENEKLVFANSYYDENWYSQTINGQNFMLSNRMISTYVNAIYNGGFVIEQMVEESDQDIIQEKSKQEYDFAWKAGKLPVTFIIKARKL